MYYVIYYVTIPEVSCTALNVKCSSVYYVVDYVIKDKYIQYYIDYNSSITVSHCRGSLREFALLKTITLYEMT